MDHWPFDFAQDMPASAVLHRRIVATQDISRLIFLTFASLIGKNGFTFGALQVSHESVLVLQKIDVGTAHLSMVDGLVDLGDDETQAWLAQRNGSFLPKRCDVSHRDCAADAGAFRSHFKIGSAGGDGRMTDVGTAVDLIVEYDDYQVRRILTGKCRQVKER